MEIANTARRVTRILAAKRATTAIGRAMIIATGRASRALGHRSTSPAHAYRVWCKQ
jgi:hypothetical protein